jgi:S-disulfanyl-L-cysteine oxidoreductase SoxD
MPSPDLQHRLAIAALAACLSSAAWADVPERPEGAAFGQPIQEEDLVLWDIDIHTPSGAGLPEGEGTVSEGEEVYAALCMHCHGERAEGGDMYGTMVGGIGSMTERPRVLTPGSMYPYAPILFDYTRRAMPLDHPQSMTADEVYAVAAYIYHLNGLIDEDFVMNAETMPTIEMPNRDAFIEDDRPDAAADRCMEDCPPIGTVEDGDHLAAAAEEAEDTPDPTEAVEQAGGTGGQVIMGDDDEDGEAEAD